MSAAVDAQTARVQKGSCKSCFERKAKNKEDLSYGCFLGEAGPPF